MLWHWSSMKATSLSGPKPPPRTHLEQDPEQLERVGRADDQVVVGVEAAVEVERAELPEPQQLGDDELDVGARARGGRCRGRRRRGRRGRPRARTTYPSPARRCGRTPARRTCTPAPAAGPRRAGRRSSRRRLGQPVLAAAHVALAGVVGALGQPDLQVARPGRVHDVDALEVVVDRLLPDLRVGVGERAELVVVVLEGVGVDRARGAMPRSSAYAAQRGVVVDQVPRDVQRDRRRQPGEPVHLRRRRRSSPRPCAACPGVPNTLNRVPELP